tara:strand:- start:179 stop:661 length:483 start_codon:yes stop_codon:yes gene_type:complete
MNKNGFQTKIWGPAAWLFLHIISFNYHPDRKEGYKTFFTSLKHVLPCGACRDNYCKNLEKMPLTNKVLKSRDSFSFWLFKLHNQIQYDIFIKTENTNNKPSFKNTKKDFNKVKMFYEEFRASCKQSTEGCTIPKKGSKKRAKILIIPFKNTKRFKSILLK